MDIEDLLMVKVTWRDAQESDGSWTSIDEILKHECAVCQDVGFLVLNDEDKVIVMRSMITRNGAEQQDYVELEEGSSYIAIPWSWILNIQELAPVGAELDPSGTEEEEAGGGSASP